MTTIIQPNQPGIWLRYVAYDEPRVDPVTVNDIDGDNLLVTVYPQKGVRLLTVIDQSEFEPIPQ